MSIDSADLMMWPLDLYMDFVLDKLPDNAVLSIAGVVLTLPLFLVAVAAAYVWWAAVIVACLAASPFVLAYKFFKWIKGI